MLTPARRLARPRSRIEYFVFSLLAEMQGHEVQLYAIKRDGALNRYPEVKVGREEAMPSGGDLSNPNDKALVRALEDTIILAYGEVLAVTKCKLGGEVDLSGKMLRAEHMEVLGEAAAAHKVESLNLQENQLGPAGAEKLAGMLKSNTTLKTLK